MKRMPLSRLFALPLALTLLLSPAAQALTPNQARELLQDYYIDEVPEDVLDQNTIQAMLEALGDPYTTYFSPEEYGAFTGSMSDTDTVGVGIYSLVTADGPLIQRVYENTPAADAGLQPGDLVTAVDGRSTAGQDAGTVAAWLKGDPGTRVELSYRRDGAEYTAVLTRRAITVPATYTELWDGHIGYIDCDTFGGETVAHFVSGMEDTAAGADHWIVDLRGNGGGEVDAAMGAAGCFTGSGVLAYLKDSTGAYGAYGSNDDARTLSPVIVLTDGETASASELFASDIRDTNTGILVGGRTFGKGVAQTVLDQRALPDYFPDGDAIKITSYRFYAPSGSTTDTVGLIPHLLVDPDLAPEVATLLSASSPKGSTEGYLRIDFNWRWYVELDTALSETHRDAFTALLEALPDGVRVLEGTGGPDGWADTTVEELVGRYVLTSYRDRSFTDTAGSPYARPDRPAGHLRYPGRNRRRSLPARGLPHPRPALRPAGPGPQLPGSHRREPVYRRIHGRLVRPVRQRRGPAGPGGGRGRGPLRPRRASEPRAVHHHHGPAVPAAQYVYGPHPARDARRRGGGCRAALLLRLGQGLRLAAGPEPEGAAGQHHQPAVGAPGGY